MRTMNQGKDLLERLQALSKDASPEDKAAAQASSEGVQKVLEGLQGKRRGLEELWNRQRKRLEQFIALSELDHEVDQVSGFETPPESACRCLGPFPQLV